MGRTRRLWRTKRASVEPDAAGVVMGTVGGTHTDMESGKRLGSHRKAAPVVSPQQWKHRTYLHRPGKEAGQLPCRVCFLSCGPGDRRTVCSGQVHGGRQSACPVAFSDFSPPKRKLQACYCFAQDRGLWSLNSLLQAMFKFLT